MHRDIAHFIDLLIQSFQYLFADSVPFGDRE